MPNVNKKDRAGLLVKLLEKSRNFALVKFENTAHRALEELRRELKTTQSSLRVVKNSLLEKALNKLSQEKKELRTLRQKAFPLRENSAVLTLSSDYTTGLKAFFNFAKKDKTLFFKLAVLEEQLFAKEELEKLSQLPSRLELLGKIIGSLKAPQSRLVYSMKFNISKLTVVLKERAKQEN